MDFALPPETEALRRRIADFVAVEIMPLEGDPASYDEHENIAIPVLERLRAKVKAAGLWAPQMPRELGGLGLNVSGMAACYETMGRSTFGPVAFNCAAPDDGNMILLARTGTPDQKRRWLMPIVEGMGYYAVNTKQVGQFVPIPGRHELGDVFERVPRPEEKPWKK